MPFHLIRWGDFPLHGRYIISEAVRQTKKSPSNFAKKLIHMTADPVQGRMSVGLKRRCFVGGVKNLAASVPRPRVWWLGRKRSAALMTAQPGGERRHIAGAAVFAAAKVRRQSLRIRLGSCKLPTHFSLSPSYFATAWALAESPRDRPKPTTRIPYPVRTTLRSPMRLPIGFHSHESATRKASCRRWGLPNAPKSCPSRATQTGRPWLWTRLSRFSPMPYPPGRVRINWLGARSRLHRVK